MCCRGVPERRRQAHPDEDDDVIMVSPDDAGPSNAVPRAARSSATSEMQLFFTLAHTFYEEQLKSLRVYTRKSATDTQADDHQLIDDLQKELAESQGTIRGQNSTIIAQTNRIKVLEEIVTRSITVSARKYISTDGVAVSLRFIQHITQFIASLRCRREGPSCRRFPPTESPEPMESAWSP
jgi:tRNA U34 5-carboxymethylaminomethyl modifying GTPase MnmE/TrmE